MTTATHAASRYGSWVHRRRPAIQFGLHYAEMVAVMFTGMLVLGGAMLLAAAAAGYGLSDIREDAPALDLIGMGVSMTVPMVAWMRWRGHSWAASAAMGMAMVVPTVAAVSLLAAGATDLHGGLAIQHIAMFPLMALAMLPYRREFIH